MKHFLRSARSGFWQKAAFIHLAKYASLSRRAVTLIGIALVLFSAAAVAFGQGAEPAATIHVNVAEEKAPVSPTLYGIFLEDINHGITGGLYGELIQNRSFQEGVLPAGMELVTNRNNVKLQALHFPDDIAFAKRDIGWPWGEKAAWDAKRALVGWSLQNEGGATGEMKLTEANPMNAGSSRSLELTVTGSAVAGATRVALVNTGYWGIGVKQGATYHLRFFLRPGTYTGGLTASLESRDGKVLASHDFGTVAPGTDWHEFTASLDASDTDANARFVLSFRGAGALQVDYVSLFPPTHNNQPNGLRQDLAQYLFDLKPAFVRYPGGCYVEGFSWESSPNWETTLGPVEQRPGTYSYWSYRSEDGFGFDEYLKFCEELHAEPLFAVNAGMTVQPLDNVPIDDLGPYIQRALDALEYANGPTTSKWGAERAKLGHPAPFNLKYIEIGNEHETPLYADYYKKFREAIHAQYPDVTVIISMYWGGLNQRVLRRAGDTNIDMVDEHAYHNNEWPRQNFTYFDGYNRNVPWKLFVGEYASQHRYGDWGGGMGDSLYLMMCERNGDLVKLAAYAPLFVNVHHREWDFDLIEFDSSRSFAHGSYYVQKAFSENRPDVNLATTFTDNDKPDPNLPLMAGKFGLGAWQSQTEFKEFRVYDLNSNLVYSDDFTNFDHWTTPGRGRWEAADSTLRQTGTRETPAMLLLKDQELKVGRVTVKARRTAGNEGFLLLFNVGGPDRFLFCNCGATGNTFSALQEHGVPLGYNFQANGERRGAIENDRWYDLSLVLRNNSAEMYLDGQRVTTARMSVLPSVFAAAGYDRKNSTVVVKATNYHPKPVVAQIQLEGTASMGASGRQISISNDGLESDNTLDNPHRIGPHEQPLSNCAQQFSVTLPPYSVNVFRIPATAAK